jgi:hypothetical protein
VPFPCPLLSRTDAEPDVVVVDGPVAPHLGAPAARDSFWEAEPGRFLLRGDARSGRFLVEGGDRITLQRSPEAEDAALAYDLLDSVLAAVLRHRGLLVLHSSAAAAGGAAVAIAGASGSGKSTAVAALLARGFALLSDDVTALDAGSVLAGPAHLHLSEESAVAVGQETSGLDFRRQLRMKAAVPAASRTEMAPLRTLFVLGTHRGDNVRIRPLGGTEKFDAVRGCVYGPVLAAEHARHFAALAALAALPVYRLERPAGRWSADEVARAIVEACPGFG